MKQRKWMLVVAMLSAFALVAAACGGDDEGDGGEDGEAAAKPCTWTIGTMGALSGDYASLGQPIADGVEFAVTQANAEGDLACELEFADEDSEGDPNKAPALAQKLVQDETLAFCACPYFSGETLATGDIFGQAGVAISGTGTNETIDEQGFETWFRGVAPDNIQAEVAASYIRDALGAQTVAIIHDNQDYSKGLAEGVQRELGDIAKGPFIINPEEPDFGATVTQVRAVNPDVVFYGGYTPEAGPLAKQLQEGGVDATFMSDDGAKDPSFGELAGNAAEGALVSCPCVDPLKIEAASEFVSGMREEYGKNAPGTFAADLYDVTNIAIDALRELNGDEDIAEVRQAVVQAFEDAEDVQGVAKSYSWNDDGEFEGGPEDIWIYEWSDADENFVSLGPAAELLEK